MRRRRLQERPPIDSAGDNSEIIDVFARNMPIAEIIHATDDAESIRVGDHGPIRSARFARRRFNQTRAHDPILIFKIFASFLQDTNILAVIGLRFDRGILRHAL